MPEEIPQLDTTARRTPGQDFYGTLYPYIDYKGGMVGSIMMPIRRAIYPVNPFASQQVASKDSYGLPDRWGNGFYKTPNFVTGTIFSNLFPNHYDPSTSGDKGRNSDPLTGDKPGPGVEGKMGSFTERLPRGCYRAKQSYDRCKMVNGKESCFDQGQWVMGVCPNWALAEMKNNKQFEKKVMLVQREEYQHAMAVSDYNSGRSVGDITAKTHIHGTRQYLRPDTMWADERYRSVTKDEIKAAKARHEARLQAEGRMSNELKPAVHAHDNTGAQIRAERELY